MRTKVILNMAAMITQIMVQPSSWVESGIQINRVKELNLFKFTDELQTRLEDLNEKKRAGLLWKKKLNWQEFWS